MSETKTTPVNFNTLSPNELVELIGRSGYVDDAEDITMRIVGVTFETERVVLKMGWFHAGIAYEMDFDSWRVKVS